MNHKEYELVQNSACYGLNYEAKGVRDMSLCERVVLSAVRAARREREVNIIPRVHGAIAADRDQWGNIYFVEVEYSRQGYRATYGGHYEGKRLVWQCYMD